MSVEQPPDLVGVVERATPPTVGEIARELADARDVSDEQAQHTVESAIDAGALVEDGGDGMFPTFQVVAGAEPEPDTEPEPAADLTQRARAAFRDSIDYFNDQLDRELPDVIGAETAWDYYIESRGWSAKTVDAKELGYAPADGGAGLLDHLIRNGYERDAILGTGLFHESLEPLWKGRLIFPYFNADGEPCYAISRSLNPDDGGHPADTFGDQKYAKAVKTKQYSRVDEPIYGKSSVQNGEPLLITEGMADAITAHQAGYPCISPVTKQFKKAHYEPLQELIEAHDIPRVYLIQDAEHPGVSAHDDADRPDDPDAITDVLTIPQFGPGVSGAADTAGFLDSAGGRCPDL